MSNRDQGRAGCRECVWVCVSVSQSQSGTWSPTFPTVLCGYHKSEWILKSSHICITTFNIPMKFPLKHVYWKAKTYGPHQNGPSPFATQNEQSLQKEFWVTILRSPTLAATCRQYALMNRNIWGNINIMPWLHVNRFPGGSIRSLLKQWKTHFLKHYLHTLY